MKRGCVIGYDINEKGCQISYYDDSMEEPDTMMASSNNYLIPLVLGYFKDRWVFGKEAKRLAVVGEDCTETDLYGSNPQDGRRRTVPGLKYVKLPKQLGSAIIRQK